MNGILAPDSAVRSWLAVAGWMVLTLVASTVPVGEWTPPLGGADKVAHAGIYAVLALLVARTGTQTRPMSMAMGRAFALAVAFGALMEWTQGLVNRDPSFYDWLADCAGAAAGLLVWRAWPRNRKTWMESRR